MGKKQMSWKTRGMNRDLSVSAFNPEFAFENRNLRLSTNENNTMLSWVNEKGTEAIPVSYEYYFQGWYSDRPYIEGIVIGTAVLNEWLVLFSHSSDGDNIYKFRMNSFLSMEGIRLFGGDLGFDLQHPIETLVSYESENIQKVYWTDKKNQPRVINIAVDKNTIASWDGKPDKFNFVRTLQLGESVFIKKILGASGVFPAGVIQYAFTYYDKYGQESNIFYTSPLLYTSHRDRGGSPEDKVDNAFEIKVNSVDKNFDYLRIYSIMRTSINGTPICKRVQDISLKDLTDITFIDNGSMGDTIDPTELLYKGGESITCETIEQKDNTLFFGNIEILRKMLTKSLKDRIFNSTSPESSTREIHPTVISTAIYPYDNQLTSLDEENHTTVPCGGFKYGDIYRLGVQFQHKTGKWSDPVWIGDYAQNNHPSPAGNGSISLPCFEARLDSSIKNELMGDEYQYVRVRPLCVYPGVQDRNILCQGVVNPTMYTDNHRNRRDASYGGSTSRNNIRRRAKTDAPTYPDGIGDLQAQSSWFFRATDANAGSGNIMITTDYGINGNKAVRPVGKGELLYYDNEFGTEINNQTAPEVPGSFTNIVDAYPELLPAVEIQGVYKDGNKFNTDREFLTFHSPDIEFDTQIWNTNFIGMKYKQVGIAKFINTLSDIDIQTETPPISGKGTGFTHRTFKEGKSFGIVSGLFYDDYLVDDKDADTVVPLDYEKDPVKWMVYLWNRTGSLNNDVFRSAGLGTRSAVLKKKIVSNLRVATTDYSSNYSTGEEASYSFNGIPQLFSDDDSGILKLGEDIYKGNVDTVIMPDEEGPLYFAIKVKTPEPGSTIDHYETDGAAEFEAIPSWKLFINVANTSVFQSTLYEKYGDPSSIWFGFNIWKAGANDDIGETYNGLAQDKSPIRMKYKSTPHLVFKTNTEAYDSINWESAGSDCPYLPIVEVIQSTVNNTRFGGTTQDALQANNWIPCGEPVSLSGNDYIRWEYGDTYFQRWDCLKTYAFTEEDENQVVEIGSFMLETRTNIDGRYDRNRGQSNNLYMSPRNFNLLNEVYSQQNNFFTYKILDSSFYENNTFPNQVTWSLTKQSGADVDVWTQITLANTLDLDGDKGKLNKIIRFNDQLIAFQDTGISQIMFNENTALTTTEGVPIEIANSGKVQGKRYLSNNIGCSNKWSIAESPGGVYFMDSKDRSIYIFNGQLSNLSVQNGFNTWSKKNILSSSMWTPEKFDNFISSYDKQNQDILFVNSESALAFSEKLGAFTSFYDYGGASWLCNIGNAGIWIKNGSNNNSELWIHQGGQYCNFFGEQKPYGMLLVGNPEPLTDKIFTNLEFRACVDGEGEFSSETTEGVTTHTFEEPYLPFDYLETWNEYQHGLTSLEWRNGIDTMRHHTSDNISHLARKFRIWRCDIPRDNMKAVDVFDYTFNNTFHQPKEVRKIDRMRNPWLYVKLKKDSDTDKRVEIHDMVMTYYN